MVYGDSTRRLRLNGFPQRSRRFGRWAWVARGRDSARDTIYILMSTLLGRARKRVFVNCKRRNVTLLDSVNLPHLSICTISDCRNSVQNNPSLCFTICGHDLNFPYFFKLRQYVLRVCDTIYVVRVLMCVISIEVKMHGCSHTLPFQFPDHYSQYVCVPQKAEVPLYRANMPPVS